MGRVFEAVVFLGLLLGVSSSGLALFQNRPETVTDLPLPSVRYAILIGVEKYDDVNIPPLTGPANDVEQMKEGLEIYAGFDEGNIFVLTTSPAANTPTRSHILTSLSRIRNMVPTNGLLLFMFSGHGVSKGDIAYLLPSDAHQTDDVELLADTALPIDLIRQRIAATGVKQAIVFLDACRNGLESSKGEGDNPLTKAFKDEFDFSRLNKEIEASVVVYATALGSRAWIDNDKHLGYFTEAITSGLSGKAADSQGRVTLRTLLDYVQSSVPQMVARDLGPSKEQKPFFELSGYKPAELVIAQTNTLSTIKEGSITATPSIDPRMPIPPNASALDFESLFKQYGNDEIPLLNLGSAAFVRANYEWTIRYLERARAIWQSGIDYSHHGAWTIGYPYLAAAYLFGQNDEVKFSSTLDEMMSTMHTPYSGLHTPIAINKVVRNLETIRAFMPPSDSEFVDKAIDQALTYAATFAPPPEPGTNVNVCAFAGRAIPGGPAYQKKETCIIPYLDEVDTQYRQQDDLDSFHGRGATSRITSSDIPPGLHVTGMGTGSWSLQGLALVSDKLSIITSCVPGPPGGAGCEVRAYITVRYRK